jgi:hypothetical protein
MSVVLDENWALANQNKAESPFDYFTKSKGILRTLQVTQKVTRLGSEIGKSFGIYPSIAVEAFDQNLGVGIRALGIPRLPSVTARLIKSLSTTFDPCDGISFQRKAAKMVRDTADAMAAYGYALSFLKFNPFIRMVAQVADFVSDIFDLPLAYCDYQMAQQLEFRATGVVREVLLHAKNYYLLTVAKVVASVAALFLGLAFAGTSAAATIGLIALSLMITIISIDRDFHESLGRYKLIKFDRPVTVS